MKIALIRHLTPLIGPGICYGRLDLAIDPAAVAQIGILAADPVLRGATRVWTSPARRCRTLADPIAETLAAQLTVDPRLNEMDFGRWEGTPWDAVARADLDLWATAPLTFAPPGGESGATLIGRVSDFWHDLRHARQDCVVVSHGGPLKVLAALLDGKPVDLLAPAPPIGSLRVVAWPATTRPS